MKKFDTNIVDNLNKECNGESIHFVGLGSYDFQISFGYIDKIQAMEKVVFSLRGNSYSWNEGPSDIPVWLLVGQTPIHFELPNLFTLRMNLESGDFVEFYTDEQQYEATIIDFGMKGDVRVMEIF